MDFDLDYQDHPAEFFALDGDTQDALLNSVCRKKPVVYVRGDWHDFKFCTVDSISFGEDAATRALKSMIAVEISGELRNGNWSRAAKLMMFFRVTSYSFGNFNDFKSFIEFAKVFPMGCFGEWKYSNSLIEISGTRQWCHGVPHTHLFKMGLACLTLDTPLFSQICQIFARGPVTVKAAKDIILWREIEHHLKRIDRDLSTEIITAFNCRRLEIVGRHEKLLFYPCLFKYHYSALHTADLGYIPRPTWSRQRHLALADKKFKQQTMTVLLMHKFRRMEFPLHKDLGDMVLEYLFVARIAELKHKLKVQRELVRGLMTMNTEERKVYCFNKGLLYDETDESRKCASLLDAHDAGQDSRLAIDLYAKCWNRFLEIVETWDSIQKILDGLVPLFPSIDRFELTRLIIVHCRKHDVSLGKLYRNAKVFDPCQDYFIEKLNKRLAKKAILDSV
jgi:hypothetical protein